MSLKKIQMANKQRERCSIIINYRENTNQQNTKTKYKNKMR